MRLPLKSAWLVAFGLLLGASSFAQEPATNDCPVLTQGVQHAEALASLCDWVHDLDHKLPNILGDQSTSRRVHNDVSGETIPLDKVEAQIQYENGKFAYVSVKVNGKPAPASEVFAHGGWTGGEYQALLHSIFRADQLPHFRFVKEEKKSGHPALVFDYDIAQKNNRTWAFTAQGFDTYHPGFHGRIWLDAKTYNALAVHRESDDDVPLSSPISKVVADITYEDVALGDQTHFVLPATARVTMCSRTGACDENVIQFAHWRKFAAHHKLMLDGNLPPAQNQAGDGPQ